MAPNDEIVIIPAKANTHGLRCLKLMMNRLAKNIMYVRLATILVVASLAPSAIGRMKNSAAVSAIKRLTKNAIMEFFADIAIATADKVRIAVMTQQTITIGVKRSVQ